MGSASNGGCNMSEKSQKKRVVRGKKENKISLSFDAPIVSPDTFKRAVNAFIELIKAVSDEVVGAGKKIQWNMSVEKGSCVVIARQVADAETFRASKLVIQAMPDGLR